MPRESGSATEKMNHAIILLDALRKIATTIGGPQTPVQAQRIARAAIAEYGKQATKTDTRKRPQDREGT